MSQFLFDLVKTLNKTEKRLFNDFLKNYNRKHYYLKMISVYGKEKEYDQNLDYKIFKNEKAGYITSCKNSFKNKLLDFLHLIRRNTAEKEIQTLIDHSDVLSERFFFTKGLKLLDKALEKALELESFTLVVVILNRLIYRESNIGIRERYSNLEYLKSLQKNRLHSIDNLKAFCLAQDRANNTRDRFYNTLDFKKKVNKRKPEKIKFGNFLLDRTNLETEYFTSLANNDTGKSIVILEQMIALMDENFQLTKSIDVAKYVKHIYDLVIHCFIANNLDKIVKLIPKFDVYPPKTKSMHHFIINFKTSACLYYAMNGKDTGFALPYVNQYFDFYDKLRRNKNNSMHSLFFCAYYYLMLGDTDRSSKVIETCKNLNINRYYKMFLDILEAILIFEKNDIPYLKSYLKSKLKIMASPNIKFEKIFTIRNEMYKILKLLSVNEPDKIQEKMNLIYSNYTREIGVEKVLIYWLVNKFEFLQNEAYQKFLNENNFKHKVLPFKNISSVRIK